MFGFSKKKQQAILQERAEDLLSTIRVNVGFANKATSFDFFMEYYDEILKAARELSEIDKKTKLTGLKGNIQYECSRLECEAQWHMRDAIEREYDRIIDESKKKYRNNPSMTRGGCYNFRDNIEKYRNRFDDETDAFANNLLRKLYLKFNLELEEPNLQSSEIVIQQNNTNQITGTYIFDEFDGNEFEYWCANLLRNSGFEDVEVTQSSGDQGVDILAKKDEIYYAIQCKCYSSVLGNKPVQEVAAGKDYYHCQIGVVMTNNYFTKSARELAKATGVLLWDRDKIIKMLNTKH